MPSTKNTESGNDQNTNNDKRTENPEEIYPIQQVNTENATYDIPSLSPKAYSTPKHRHLFFFFEGLFLKYPIQQVNTENATYDIPSLSPKAYSTPIRRHLFFFF